MRQLNRTFALLIPALLALGGASLAETHDWPQWRGPERNGRVPADVAVPQSLPASPTVVWHKPIGFAVASPVVAGGRVIYLDNQDGKEVVHAVDAKTGEEAWRVELDLATQDTQSKSGPRTTPMVDGDRVYAQSCRGTLKCLNLADGKSIWESNYVKDFKTIFIGEKGKAEGSSRHGYTATPIVDGEHLLTEVGGPGAGIICFDKKSGSIIWKSGDDMPGYAPPILATIAGVRQMVAFTAVAVIGVDPASGKELWRVPVKTALGRHAATPIAFDDWVVVSSFQAGMLGIKLSREGEGLKAEQAWKSKEAAINFAAPVAVDSSLFGVGPNKNLICVDIPTGKILWSKDNFFTSSGGKAYAGMMVMGKNLLVLTDDGQLVMIAADSSAYHEISRAQGCGTNWCNPAYADGKLYLRDANELRCLELMK